jgi:UDP-galactopyranose mutase
MTMPDSADLIVFSHLRWHSVFQRPQHLLSRMAAYRRVFFIEEPIHAPGAQPHWVCSDPAPNVRVCQPYLPDDGVPFSDAQIDVLKPMLARLAADEPFGECVVWLYTPMACPLAQTLSPQAVVYDCMDELSAFKDAPPQLLEREAAALQWADVVFTGGPSLYRAKQGLHANVYCFPSSVDVAHYQPARPDAPRPLPEPADQAGLPRPRLGYFGVIDERMDLALLGDMAVAHPEWHIIMLGPVVKIDPGSLPRHPNLYYLGPKAYADLPAYLAGWDVCLLPFARNAATRFISPTKTLEYMAAERMIVSTPIADVARPYGEIVYLGDSSQAFILACERALKASPAERARRVSKMREVLARTSWNTTARAMELLIDRIVEARQPLPAGTLNVAQAAERGLAQTGS